MAIVLSLFPGAGLLDLGFERAGFCVVRGPDVIFGQRIESFHAPAGHFIGVIGGPPCQDFSRARRSPPTGHGLRMLEEFRRVVTEAAPDWWLCENVPGVPSLVIHGYEAQRFNLYATDFGLRQSRNRAFQFGSKDGVPLLLQRSASRLPPPRRNEPWRLATVIGTVTTKTRQNFANVCEAQGLPRSYDIFGISRTAKFRAVANGVPVPMAEAVAVAIRERGRVAVRLCVCRCGREVTGKQISATPACRKRLERSRLDASRLAQSRPAASQFEVPEGHVAGEVTV